METHGNNTSDAIQALADKCDSAFSDAVVGINNAPENPYNTLVISVSGSDKDEVAKRASEIESTVRAFAEYTENGGRSTVERMTNDDYEGGNEHYDVLVHIDGDGAEQ